MSESKVDEAREAVMMAAHGYAIAEGSGADTTKAQEDVRAALDEFEAVVRSDEIGKAR